MHTGTREREEIDIDFAWKHVEILLLKRKSNWGKRERLEGGARLAAVELMMIK